MARVCKYLYIQASPRRSKPSRFYLINLAAKQGKRGTYVLLRHVTVKKVPYTLNKINKIKNAHNATITSLSLIIDSFTGGNDNTCSRPLAPASPSMERYDS